MQDNNHIIIIEFFAIKMYDGHVKLRVVHKVHCITTCYGRFDQLNELSKTLTRCVAELSAYNELDLHRQIANTNCKVTL